MYTENQGNGYNNNCDCGDVQATNIVLAPKVECPVVVAPRAATVRIPVLIATANVEADVEACIDFPCHEDFHEIKRIKKNVFITQGRIIPLTFETGTQTTLGKLFLKGFVEKNIEYATADCVSCDKEVINGRIKSHTVKVPFQVATQIDITNIVINNRGPLTERTIFCDTSKERCCFDCDDGIKGRSFCESDFNEAVNFFQRPFVVLDSFRIFELDFNKEPEPLHKRCPDKDGYGYGDGYGDGKGDGDGYGYGDNHNDCEPKKKAVVFKKIEEKFVLFLCVRVLQNQFVRICPPTPPVC
ncbi:hypothetical protein CPJCM30710_21810 [Clostridium polyendosporum]|uniref:DUF7852 domain-containing protein n=1 Tax=Clostridium polyendosporum TaxID=69208 RepID=A0A919S1L3_9CLOT|nr:hypothetical protein [Clostridium polyendosporum]GIM29515.1 hypothetical protein CPJCM30710_21810 [Clostridium polyendosporum]